MVTLRRFAVAGVFAFAVLGAMAADSDNPAAQGVFDERVRTLRVRNASDNLTTGTPVIVLNTSDAVNISFDMLQNDRSYLRCELIHCNADWQPSTLSPVEYVDGFNEFTIDDYAFSAATTVPYIHYSITLPHPDAPLLVSGNYAVRIYDEDHPETTLIGTRFSVSEQSAAVGVFVTSRTDVDYNRAHQQLEVTVDCERAPVADLFNDVRLVISQNGRTDNVVTLSHPLRVSGRRLIFEHQPQLIFNAGNEYRRIETISNQIPGMGIDAIEWHAPYYNHYPTVDQSRTGTPYQYDQTLHGGFVVREYNSDDSDTEADYSVVHFALEMPELINTDIFIDSDIPGRRFDPSTRMVYNRATGRYELAMLLKQGAYSYQYLAVPSGSSTGRTDFVEGDKYQTCNQYNIDVYTRVPGQRYDRLIGHAVIFSDAY